MPKTYELLGVRVHAMSIVDLIELVARAVEVGGQTIVANHNLHSIYLYHHCPKMRSFYQMSQCVYIDGMPIVLWGRMLGLRLDRSHRITSLDWMPPLLARAEQQNWRVFYLGGRPGIAEHGARVWKQDFPRLEIETHHGFFDHERTSVENRNVLARLHSFSPHLLFVGLGMPAQEIWVLENRADISAHAIFDVGGHMDYVAGAAQTPPRWLGRWGLEWLYRLASEPRRLSHRYLVEPWFMLRLMASELRDRSRGR